MRPSFFHHLHPPTIPARQARLRHTLGAGGLSVFLVLVLIATGLLEMFFYVPTPEQAALSIQTITFLVPFGGLIRNLHYWAAQLLVAVAGLHWVRVVFTGAFIPPRRFNYLLGLCLLVLVLVLDFSGYVLRWDEGIHWALVSGTNLLKTIPLAGNWLYGAVVGGSRPGPDTLIRFYAWHVFGLTLPLVILGGWHLFRVRRDGGIAAPPPGARTHPGRISRIELVRREALAALLASALLLALAALVRAPLAPPIGQPGSLSDGARAPWFFLWVQQLLKWGNPLWMGVVIPLALLTLLAALPYLFPRLPPEQLGRWFPPAGRISQVMVALLFLFLFSLSLLALK